MSLHMQNPAVQGGASRNQLGGWLHPFNRQTDRRTQLLVSRFSLSPAMARAVSVNFYGEGRDD
jgi:hypothetical protein